ncbi:uncharacterized protein B0T15DRAFT_574751 [Chaetomium strumarium]|uniref:Uncharacterized protein n=1 Tax=Chaetomium strumarium TaxID=1170767 RepID=A0AAJ0GSQ3_9PEZI|nr:hypothetical protein B0T15DRAFT_574751 [Chaetomium strumarium]
MNAVRPLLACLLACLLVPRACPVCQTSTYFLLGSRTDRQFNRPEAAGELGREAVLFIAPDDDRELAPAPMESSGCESDALLLESSRILPPTNPVSAREGRAYISTLRHWWIALVQELEAQGRPVSQLTEARGQQFLALCRRTLTYQREPDEDWRGNLCFLQRELEVLRFRLAREAEFHPVIRRLEAMWEASARQLCDRGRRLLGLRVRERDWDNVGSWRTSEPLPPCPDNIDEGTWELVLTAPWSEISRRLRMECWSLTRLLWLAARFAPLPFQRIREHIDG